MTNPVGMLADLLATDGVDPGAKVIERPDTVPPDDWLQACALARDIVMLHLPERQRRLVELVYEAECAERIDAVRIDAAIEEAEQAAADEDDL